MLSKVIQPKRKLDTKILEKQITIASFQPFWMYNMKIEVGSSLVIGGKVLRFHLYYI